MKPRRWLLAALAAGLVCVVLGATSTPGPAADNPPRARSKKAAPRDTVLVRIGSEAITTAMVQERLDELPETVRPNFTSPDGRQRLLERMIEERVWLLAAGRAGVPDRPELKRQLDQQRRDLVIRTYVSELMANSGAPADSEVRGYYDEHQQDYHQPATVTLSHLQTKSEKDARRLLGFARRQDWRKLVARYSTDSLTRANGGQLGVVTREGLFGSIGAQPALAESAFTLAEGQVGGPFQTDHGWHLIRVESLRPEGVRPFEQVRSQILRQLSSRRSQEHYQSELERAKQELKVRPDSAAIRDFLTRKKSAREQFNEAQMAGPPAARIQAYRELLAEHPDSDVSPQAQFMIGFIQSEEIKDYDAAEGTFRELLAKWPKSELVPSARWMIEHMRTEEAPTFLNVEGDTLRAVGGDGKESSQTP